MSSQAVPPCAKLSDYQLETLENNFNNVSKHPDGVTLTLFAAECGLSEEDTLVWFRHRVEQWRRAEGLPAKEGSVFQ